MAFYPGLVLYFLIQKYQLNYCTVNADCYKYCDNDYESVRPVADVAVADFVSVHIADAPAADDDYGKIDYSIGETFVAMSSY